MRLGERPRYVLARSGAIAIMIGLAVLVASFIVTSHELSVEYTEVGPGRMVIRARPFIIGPTGTIEAHGEGLEFYVLKVPGISIPTEPGYGEAPADFIDQLLALPGVHVVAHGKGHLEAEVYVEEASTATIILALVNRGNETLPASWRLREELRLVPAGRALWFFVASLIIGVALVAPWAWGLVGRRRRGA